MLKEFVKVATKASLPQEGMVSVTVGGDDILIARIGERVFALSDWCTHAAGRLHEGRLRADACEVMCPIHTGCFDLRTGEPTRPPADEPVVAYSVRVEGDDILVGPKQ
jgi:3-phenylpropionate/trans-cinnamate dioxygenase ferredoxin component